MFTLDQLKRKQPFWTANGHAERVDSMAGFDNMVVFELSLPAPICSGCPAGTCYGCLDHGARVTYWAKQRRRRVRMWRKRLADLAVQFARDLVIAAEAEGGVK